MIKMSDVSLGYGRHTVLTGVSLEIRRGDVWFFLGPNGEGKSTLLKAFLGSLRPVSGIIQFEGGHKRHQALGFVPQRCDFNPSLPTTVREFVSWGRVGLKDTDSEPQDLRWALQRVGLGELACKNYWTLSGGQRQRALVARALVRRPSLLIADEPTNGLDVASETTLLDNIAALNREQQMTIVLVTHDLQLAARYATHAAIFHQGRVTAGTRAEILHPGRLSKTYNLPETIFRHLVD